MNSKKTISQLLFQINEGEYAQAKSSVRDIINEKIEEKIRKDYLNKSKK